jgi:hypothetical protein
VETLARRGYRFLAPVERIDTQTRELASAPALSTPVPTDEALHPELEVPLPNRGLSRGLFALIQVMYLSFYLAALFHLHQVARNTESILPWWGASTVLVAVLVTAGVGIPLRFYLFSAATFDYRRLGEKFQKLFLFIMVLDQLWAIAPFLMTPTIGFGAAFAATAALLYVPFSERTLVKMAYPTLPHRG